MLLSLFLAAAGAAPLAATAEQDIIVSGSAYRGEVASGGARIDVPVEDLPLSITVLTEELIDDRQVRNLRELADNVAGVRSRSNGSGAFTIDFTVRGLQSFGQNIALNGYRVETFATGFDPQGVERIEFLKGPASVIYGASGALSGLINIVTKTPKPGDFLAIELTGGQYGYGRAGIDANTQLSETLAARLNAAVTTERILSAFRDSTAQFASPSLRWTPAPNLSVLVEGSYFHLVGPTRGQTNFPAVVQIADLPKRLKLGEPADRFESTGYNARGEISWEIAPGLTLRQGVNYQDLADQDLAISFFSSSGELFAAPNLLNRAIQRGSSTSRYLVSQSEVRWTFDLGPTSHKLLAGFEYSDAKFGGFCCDGADIAPLDLTNPVYGAPIPTLTLTELFNNTIETKAAYIQDFVEWGRFKLLAGLRYDDTRSTSSFCSLLTPGCAENDPVARNLGSAEESALSPRLGLVWQPTDRTTLFVSYAKSFNPNTSLDRNNRLLPPERGVQYEAGIRQELLAPGQLSLSLAAFELTRRNISECDPLFPDCDRSVAIGEQRVRGFEAELGGKPADWLDLIATYAYLDGEVTETDPAITGVQVGSDLPEAARHSASIFAKLGLDPVGLRGVSVSTGVYYVSSRPGRDFFGSFFAGPFADPLTRLPASTRVDLGAYWNVSEQFRLQANITNLFDEDILEPVNQGFNRAQPFRATIGARIRL